MGVVFFLSHCHKYTTYYLYFTYLQYDVKLGAYVFEQDV